MENSFDMPNNDHDLLIRMDTKLDIFIRQQELLSSAFKTLGERFESEREKVWSEIGKINDNLLARESFDRGRKWVFAAIGMVLGAIPPSVVIAVLALIL